MARAIPPEGQAHGTPSDKNSAHATVRDIELLSVFVSRKATKVDAQWAIHPQLRHDLLPDEWKEVMDLMVKATVIVGTRFSKVLSKVEPAAPGHS